MLEEKKQVITRRRFVQQVSRTSAAVAITGATAGLSLGCGAGRSDTAYDVLIKGGLVHNGTLAPPRRMDIGIKGDKIVATGALKDQASRTVDASGFIVTPGFIDVHTHCDLTFKTTGLKRYLAYVKPSWKGNYNYLYQGVTTVVTGNCGYGYADLDEWFGILDSIGFGTNVYHLAPHGIIREELFGTLQPGGLSAAQLSGMKKRVSEEMEKGAIGLSAGLEYAPGLLATKEELIALSQVVRSYGGLFTVHMRDESGSLGPGGEQAIIRSIREAIDIARQSQVSVEISHLKIRAPINQASPSQMLDLIEAARGEGLDVSADQYPYAAGSTMLSFLVPDLMKTSAGVKEVFKTRKGRAEIKKNIERQFAFLGPEKILITRFDENEAFEGRYLNEIADMMGTSPAEAFVELVCADAPPMAVFFSQDMKIVNALMARGDLITVSDGWTVPKDMTVPHPRVYGTFPRKLRKFALDQKMMDLTAAIHSMTGMSAAKFNIKGRGTIREGQFADIAVLDLNHLTDKATYKDPHQYATGIEYLFVNGKLAIDKKQATGCQAGIPIRRT